MNGEAARLIGRIGWVMQPGYPELSGEEGDETITERYIVEASEITAIPLPGTTYSNPDHSFFNAFSSLRLRSRTVRAMTGGKTYEVVLVYAYPPGMAPLGDTQVYESVEYTTREFSAPLNLRITGTTGITNCWRRKGWWLPRPGGSPRWTTG